ncbi:MAG: lipoyl domain-containing protein [Alphaproteobacteria bacterium]|nr:lipoyl domain-containing protein [Alphaproteobacteria bacterium]
METAVVMPQLGNEIEEAQITGILKQVGDKVAAGEAVLEITTPKIAIEIEAPVAGTVSALHVSLDDLAPIGATLMTITS